MFRLSRQSVVKATKVLNSLSFSKASYSQGKGKEYKTNVGIARENGYARIIYNIEKGSKVTWNPVKIDSGYRVEMNAQQEGGDSWYHKSEVIPQDVFKQLGQPNCQQRDVYYIVRISCPKSVDIEKYFP